LKKEEELTMKICHAFHGLSAYSGIKTPLAIAQAAIKIQRELFKEEVCVADRPIGPVGLCLAGPISCAFDRDIWSIVDENGKRDVSDEQTRYWYVENPSDKTWQESCLHSLIGSICSGEYGDTADDVMDYNDINEAIKYVASVYCEIDFRLYLRGSRHYCEAWMHHPTIVSVWVKKWADTNTFRVAKKLARIFSVRLHVVDGTTRIWEMYGDMEVRSLWYNLLENEVSRVVKELDYDYFEFDTA